MFAPTPNLAGQLGSLAAPDATLAFAYDGFLQTAESWSGMVAGSVTRTFDNDFRVTSLQMNTEPPIAFGYDSDGLLTQAGSLSLSRDLVNGLLTATSLGPVSDAWSYTAVSGNRP